MSSRYGSSPFWVVASVATQYSSSAPRVAASPSTVEVIAASAKPSAAICARAASSTGEAPPLPEQAVRSSSAAIISIIRFMPRELHQVGVHVWEKWYHIPPHKVDLQP